MTSTRVSVLGTLIVLLSAACSVPNHDKVWLSYNSFDRGCDSLANCPDLTNESDASYYYQTIGAEDANGNPNFNLEQWKQLFGYADATVIRAVYGNKLDLLFGRDMNCWQPQGTERVVCYVANYGPPPFAGGKENLSWPSLPRAVFDAAEADIHKSFGTVAMVYDPNGVGPDPSRAPAIAFYAFGKADADGNQPLIRSVALDGEGPKTVPGMCQSCHSGGYHYGPNRGNFLPFDVQSFSFDSRVCRDDGFGGLECVGSDFDLDNQQEAFRQLNALVMKTNPTPAIKNLINGLYAGNVDTPGATVPDDGYIPAGWDVDKPSRNLYRHVYRPYCRTCHLAQGYKSDLEWDLSFPSFSEFTKQPVRMQMVLCGFHSMPNAQVPYGSFRPAPGSNFGYPEARSTALWTDGVAQSDLRASAIAGCF